MPITTELTTGRSAADTSPAAWTDGRQVNELPQGWVDNIVHRMFNVLNIHLIKLETAAMKADGSEEPRERENPDKPITQEELDQMEKRARMRETNVRTLERLERMLNRLIQTETGRTLRRNSRSVNVHEEARITLIRQFNRLVGPDQQVPLLPRDDE